MESQTLILVAGAILATIGVLYFLRGTRASQKTATLVDTTALQTILASCAADFPTKQLNERVTRFLTSTLGCEKLIFVRKKRGLFELAYYYGIRSFDRRAFSIGMTRQLSERLKRDYVPKPVDQLAKVAPTKFLQSLDTFGITHFVPIFWRDNVYGLYFFSPPVHVAWEEASVMIASASSALAASYHTRWQENKGEAHKDRPDVEPADMAETAMVAPYPNFMRLVGHRNSETIVPRMVESIKRDLNLNRIALVFNHGDGEKEVSTVSEERDLLASRLSATAYQGLFAQVKDRSAVPIESLVNGDSEWSEWGRSLLDQGMTHLSPFSLASKQSGIMAWSGENSSEQVGKHLAILSSHAPELIDNAASYQQLEVMSYTDPLTGLANQRYLMKRLSEEINRSARYQRQLALIMFDVDSLKKINDTLGHLAGDEVLRQMGAIFKTSIRAIDLVARYGGDEFCIIMPEADDETCLKFMERLRAEVASCPIRVDETSNLIHCTVSLGGAVFPQHGDDARKLIFSADMALLKAKEQGRNGFLLFGRE
jgi:diguanylate cyclase (GGDEF)-like protein